MDKNRALSIAEQIVTVSFIAFACGCVVSISITQIAFSVGALAWLTSAYLKNSWKEIRLPLGITFFLFALAALLTSLFAIDPSRSFYVLKKLLQITIFFFFLNNLKSPEQIRLLLKIIFIVAACTALYACFKTFETGLGLLTRAEGTMSIYVTFAALLMLVSLMVSSLLIFDFNWRRDWWLFLILFLNLAGLALSLTRSAWVGLFVGLGFLVFLKNWKLLILIPVVFVALILVSPGQVQNRAWSTFDPSNPTVLTRVNMWKVGVKIWKDYPITGIGFFSIPKVFEQYKVSPNQRKTGGLHSNIFQLLAASGILGITTWLGIWLVYFLKCHWIFHGMERADPFVRAVTAGSAASVGGFLAAGLFEVNFFDSEVVMLLYFLMAIPFALCLMRNDSLPGWKGGNFEHSTSNIEP